MTTAIILFTVAGLAFIVFGTMINKESGSGNRESNKLFVALMRLFGVAILIVGNAYAVIDSKGWTTDNVKMFSYIALLTPVLIMALVGLRFMRLAARGRARTGALIWIVLWLGMGGFGYLQISNSGKGWTEESKKNVTDKVTPYDRMCYLNQIMEMYDTPEEYNDRMTKDEAKITKRMEENCRTCDLGEAEEVEGLPDDF